MRGLTASDVVQAWETGRGRHPIDRGLLLLALADPQLSWNQLASLSVGQRNGRLLNLRAATLGAKLSCYAKCLHCSEALEFQFDAATIRQPEPECATFAIEAGGYTLHCRLPTSIDLAEVVELADADEARQLLIDRCVLEASQDGAAIPVRDLPDTIIAALAEGMSDHDPGAETRFLLSCFKCGEDSSVLFDIVSYFWTEIEAYAKRLILEVDALARVYAWREADILAMSSDRRKLYLDLVGK